jgi:PadR family transcriptional regulator
MELSLLELQLLLAITSLRPNAYGSSILAEINKCTKRSQWQGTIYAALDRLEERGLVKKVLESKPSPKRGGKRRLIWGLTTPGRKTLRQMLRMITPLLRTRNRIVQPQRLQQPRSDPCSTIAGAQPEVSFLGRAKKDRNSPGRTAAADFLASKM